MNPTPNPEAVEEDIRRIGLAPLVVFYIIAAADGDIDAKEIKCFSKLLQKEEYRVLTAAMANTGMSFPEMLSHTQQNLKDPHAELVGINTILGKLVSEESAFQFKAALLKLGKGIAEASGGLFGLFGNKISKNEAMALALIADALGLLKDKPANPETEAKYMDKADFPDNMFPLLKPSTWAEESKGEVVQRCIYGDCEIKPDEPVVAYAIDSDQTVVFVASKEIHGDVTLSQVHAKAMENLEKRLVQNGEWEKIHVPLPDAETPHFEGLLYTGDYYCSEALLSTNILKRAHEKLDAALLMVIAPVRGRLYVTKLMSEGKPEVDKIAFAAYALKNYFNPPEAPIAPNVWIVRNGKLVGHVDGMDEFIEKAREHAELERKEEDSKLGHKAVAFKDQSGFGLALSIEAEDIEIMLKNLQYVIRNYLVEASKKDAFSGQLKCSINITDPAYGAATKKIVVKYLDDMFEFLGNQFETLGLKAADGTAVRMSYQLV
jgi:hypothetical protein